MRHLLFVLNRNRLAVRMLGRIGGFVAQFLGLLITAIFETGFAFALVYMYLIVLFGPHH